MNRIAYILTSTILFPLTINIFGTDGWVGKGGKESVWIMRFNWGGKAGMNRLSRVGMELGNGVGNGALFLVYIPGFWIGKDGGKLQGLK